MRTSIHFDYREPRGVPKVDLIVDSGCHAKPLAVAAAESPARYGEGREGRKVKRQGRRVVEWGKPRMLWKCIQDEIQTLVRVVSSVLWILWSNVDTINKSS